MRTRMARFASAYVLGSLIAIAGCDDGGGKKLVDDDDPSLRGDGGDAEAPAERVRDGGRNSNNNDAGDGGDAATNADAGGNTGDDAGGGNSDAGNGKPGLDATTTQPADDAGNTRTDGGGMMSGGDCAAKAKTECEYQKMCDPVQFAIEWDGDMNQFCIPKRKAACEAGLPLTAPRAIGDACDTWVKASCDNYRNFHYKVTDSNGKWQYGDRACEVTPGVVRGNRALNDACINKPDTQCKEGLFCKVESDDFTRYGEENLESTCGKCAPQYAYDGAYTLQGFTDDYDVCTRQAQCKAGYQCLRVYGVDNGKFGSFDYTKDTEEDLSHCVKNITVVGQDKDCAKGSNIRCDEGLECQGATPADIVGKCKVPSSATVPTYVGKDARCDPAECDKRLHLECKPVNTGTTTEKRCVQTPVSAIGAYCKNDKNEVVASCSRYARCVDSTGLCVRRDTETQPCFNSSATPGINDPGSCDPSVYAEDLLVCRREGSQLMTICQKPLPQNLCSKR